MSAPSLPTLALVVLVGVCAGAFLKVRRDEAAFAAERARVGTDAPAPAVPAGLDGRPLDPTISTAPKNPPPPGAPPASRRTR